MSDEPFLSPRLIGKRFENHAIPLEFLKDFAVFEEMLIEVAKWHYREKHGNRRRSKRGLTVGVSLVLSGVKSGSAIAEIQLEVSSSDLFAESQPYLEDARDSILDAIAAAENDTDARKFLPDKALSYFDRFGRSLLEDEAIEFSTARHGKPIRLSRGTRRRLLLASPMQELSDEVSITGTIPEADQEKLTFEMLVTDEKRIRGKFLDEHLDTIKEAWDGYGEGKRIRLKGVGRFSRNGRLHAIDSIEHLSILDPLDIPARIEELRLLKNGWLNGEGVPLNPSGLDWLTSAFERYYADDLPLPCLFPTPEGAVRAEWQFPPFDISLEIDLEPGHLGEWHALNLEDGKEQPGTFRLSDPKQWEELNSLIRKFAEANA